MIKSSHIYICGLSGEPKETINFLNEYSAHTKMDEIFKHGVDFKNTNRIVSEFYSSLCIGIVRMYAIDDKNVHYLRREFYINA